MLCRPSQAHIRLLLTTVAFILSSSSSSSPPPSFTKPTSQIVFAAAATELVAAAAAGAAAGQVISYQTKWFTQRLDHLNPADKATFKQRYLVDARYWCGHNCPILFYCGAEGDIEVYANSTGWMWENGPKLEALLVFAEHRYYGRSWPDSVDELKLASLSEDEQTETLSKLKVEQALRDYVALIKEIKGNLYAEATWSPVITIGGSYGAMLAAWLRISYPRVVLGALAGSAPLRVLDDDYDCYSFDRAAGDSYRRQSSVCLERIRSFQEKLNSEQSNIYYNQRDLSSVFKLCNNEIGIPSDLIDANYIHGYVSRNLHTIFGHMAMTDYAHPANIFASMPANPVREACQIITGNKVAPISDRELLHRIAKASQIFTNHTGQLSCLDVTKSIMPPQWGVQWESELAAPMCSDGTTGLSIDQIVRGGQFDRYKFPIRYEKIKALGGSRGSLREASNIIFSTGLRDPWNGGCIHESLVENSIYTIEIANGSHHEDLCASGPNDSFDMQRARQLELNITNNWLHAHYYKLAGRQFGPNESSTAAAAAKGWLTRHPILAIEFEQEQNIFRGILSYLYNMFVK